MEIKYIKYKYFKCKNKNFTVTYFNEMDGVVFYFNYFLDVEINVTFCWNKQEFNSVLFFIYSFFSISTIVSYEKTCSENKKIFCHDVVPWHSFPVFHQISYSDLLSKIILRSRSAAH